MTFETQVVAPWLMAQMKASLDSFSASAVLVAGPVLSLKP